MLTEDQVRKALEEVDDPELKLNIVDLGLVYGIKIEKEKVLVRMTLTTPGCPLYGVIAKQIEEAVKSLDSKIKIVATEFVFDPPWDFSRMSAEARLTLGI